MDREGLIWKDPDPLKSLKGDLANHLTGQHRASMAMGRCERPTCPAGQVVVTLTERADDGTVPMRIPRLVCAVCQTRIRVESVDIRVAPDGG